MWFRGGVQDSLLGTKLFTKRDTFVERDLVMNVLMWLSTFEGKVPKPAILKPRVLWTGKQIFSMLIPPVNLLRKSAQAPEREPNDDFTYTDTKVSSVAAVPMCCMSQPWGFAGAGE